MSRSTSPRRAEIAMAYLLHRLRDHDIEPVSEAEFFAAASAVVDYGIGPGLVAHQTPGALAAVVTKPGYVKCAYVPHHDDWFVDVAGKSACFLPSTDIEVLDRHVRVYTRLRDGIDATATVLSTPSGRVAFVTLPDGSVVYASTGIAPDEGVIRVPGRIELGPGWVDVDARVRFVIRAGANPARRTDEGVILSAGPPTPLHIEAGPETAAPIEALSLRASLIGGQLALINLGADDVPRKSSSIVRPSSRADIGCVMTDGWPIRQGFQVPTPSWPSHGSPSRVTSRRVRRSR